MPLVRPGWPNLNAAHRLANGLVWCVAPGGASQQELISRRKGTLSTNGDWWSASHEVGRVLESKSNSIGGAWWPWVDSLLTLGTEYTFVTIAKPISMSGNAKLLCVPYHGTTWSAPYIAIELCRNGTGTGINFAYGESTNYRSWSSATGMIQTTDGMTTYAASRRGTRARFYRNGVQYGSDVTNASNTHSVASSFVNKTDVHLLHRSKNNAGEGHQGLAAFAAIYNRELSAVEMRDLHANWQELFADGDIVASIIVPAIVGGGGLTLDAVIADAADTITCAMVAPLALSAAITDATDTISCDATLSGGGLTLDAAITDGNDSITCTVIQPLDFETGAGWPTSGAASAGTSGLSVCTGFTHVGSSDLPPGSLATGFLRGADDAAVSWRLSASTGVAFQGAALHHVERFWLRATRTATALAADNLFAYIHTFTDSGTKLRTELRIRNNSRDPGLAINITEFLTGGTNEALNGVGSSGMQAAMAFGEWTEFCVHLFKDATNGFYAFYLNGVLVARQTGLDTSTLTSGALAAQWTMSPGATAGIRWDLCGTLENWGTDAVEIRPRHSLRPSSSFVARVDLCRWINDSAASVPVRPMGLYLRRVSGTATLTPTAYASGGVNPLRYRVVVGGSAADVAVWETIDPLGAPVYNALGDCTVLFPMAYIASSTASLTLAIRNATDTADIASVNLDGATAQFREGTTNKQAITNADRYQVCIHLSQDGSVTYTLVDQTKDLSAGQILYSGTLTGWTPQELGRVRFSAVRGSSDVQCEGVVMARWWDLPVCDSMVAANTNGLTPVMAAATHVAASLNCGFEMFAVPGGNYRYKGLGAPFACSWAIGGRSGRTRDQVTSNLVAHMTHTRGCRLVNVDGGSINDIIAGAGPGTEESTADDMIADCATMATQCVATRNRAWFTTMIPRNRDGEANSTTTDQREALAFFNDKIREQVREFANNGLMEWSDVTANIADPSTLFGAGDAIHATGTGDATIALEMYENLEALDGELSASITDSDDSIACAMTVGGGALTLDAAITDATDTITATIAVALSVAATITDANDTLSASMVAPLAVSATIADAADTIACTAAVQLVLTAAIADATDTIACTIAAAASSVIDAAITDGNDSVSCTATTNVYWLGDISDDWSTAGNWSSGIVPSSVDNVIIDGSGLAISFTLGTTTVGSLLIDDLFAGIAYLGGGFGQVINVAGNCSIKAAAFSFGMDGSVWNVGGNWLCDASLIASSAWYLHVAGTGVFNGACTVTRCDASGGTAIDGRFAVSGIGNVNVYFGLVTFGQTDATDTISATMSAPIAIAATITDGNDTISCTMGAPAAILNATITDATDTVTATVAVTSTISAALADATDVITCTISAPISAAATINDGSDTIACSVATTLSLAAALTDAADGISATIGTGVIATLTMALHDGTDAVASAMSVSAPRRTPHAFARDQRRGTARDQRRANAWEHRA